MRLMGVVSVSRLKTCLLVSHMGLIVALLIPSTNDNSLAII